MQFLVAYEKTGYKGIKIRLDDEREVWMIPASDAVFNYAKGNFQKEDTKNGVTGEVAKVTYKEENGNFTISRIEKVNGETNTVQSTGYSCSECGKQLKDNKYKKCYDCNKGNPVKKEEFSQGGYKCTDCGKELKDNKYDKCYTCNQKNPSTKNNTYSKSPADSEQIKRLAVLKSCCIAVQAMNGFVDNPKVLGDIVENLYDRLYKKVS